MLLGAVTTGFAHGLLIVAAPESTDSHDSWDASTQVVHGGPDSLYIGVRDAASGLVRVEFHDDGADPGLRHLYSGALTLPSMKLIAYDPNQTSLLTILTDAENISAAVYGDDADESGIIVILVAGREAAE